jgi:hypothetical protein
LPGLLLFFVHIALFLRDWSTIRIVAIAVPSVRAVATLLPNPNHPALA